MNKVFSIILIITIIMVAIIGCEKEKGTTSVSNNNNSIEQSAEKGKDNFITADYSKEFGDIKGCAVFYDYEKGEYYVYNEEECNKRYSPCSIFKIVSALEGLKYEVVTDENSKMKYNGNKYPFEAWNKDIGFKDAFQSSCVWYFRQLTDKVGIENFKNDLTKLNYGNCDVSEWNGSGINPISELNGFWLGSTLEITPLEAVKCVCNIFEGKTDYSKNHISMLKNFMESEFEGIYGKTGTSFNNEAWYNGFYENEKDRIYFAVHLSNGDGENVAGADAKEIANKIVNNYFYN